MGNEKRTCTCIYCGKRFVPDPTKINSSREGCGTNCPMCGMRTPIPFQIYVETGGKIPGEK